MVNVKYHAKQNTLYVIQCTHNTHKNVPFFNVYFTNTFTNIRQLVLNNRCLDSCVSKPYIYISLIGHISNVCEKHS